MTSNVIANRNKSAVTGYFNEFEGYTIRRFTILGLKLYLRFFLSLILYPNAVRVGQMRLRRCASIAYLLSRAKDKKRMHDYLVESSRDDNTVSIAYQVFCLSRCTNVELDVLNDDFLLIVGNDGGTYRFKLNQTRRPGDQSFAHDLFSFVDIFCLHLYDLYDYRDGVVLDVGAYVGDTSVYFARNGARKVYAYEPNPMNFQYLLSNLALNGVGDQVVAQNVGITSGAGKLIVPRSAGGAGSVYSRLTDAVSFNMKALEPRRIFENQQSITLLKMDCKGCEYDVLTRSLGEISDKVGHVIMQVDMLDDEQTKEIIARLVSCGFRLDKEGPVSMLYFSK